MASAASHLPPDPQAMLAVPAVSCAEGAERDAGAGAAPRRCTPRRRRVCDEAESEVRGEEHCGWTARARRSNQVSGGEKDGTDTKGKAGSL